MAAMRVARTVTGRKKIALFTGGLPRQFDEVLVKGAGRPGSARARCRSRRAFPPRTVAEHDGSGIWPTGIARIDPRRTPDGTGRGAGRTRAEPASEPPAGRVPAGGARGSAEARARR